MPTRPNILWIMTDQFNANAMGFLGAQVRTPSLDRLAADGVNFRHAYCNNPICAPSRVSFLTGQYLHTHGIQGNRVVAYPRRNSETCAAVLRRAGYRTALVGKAHLPRLWVEEGFERVLPSRLVQFGRMDWDTLKQTYATPAPVRGRVPTRD